jgi:hypothetical protein
VEFRPEILRSNIGCGIGSAIVRGFDFTPDAFDAILAAVDEIGIDIGRGNHFIEFTTEHPKATEAKLKTNMIFLHTHFNLDNKIPKTLNEARAMQKDAIAKRREYLVLLMDKLGFAGDLYKDWVHNSLFVGKKKVFYRMGCIDVRKTGNEGIITFGPGEGIMFYVGIWESYYSSMQSAMKKPPMRRFDIDSMQLRKKRGIARGFVVNNTSQLSTWYEDQYDRFLNRFFFEWMPIGWPQSKLIIKTKA